MRLSLETPYSVSSMTAYRFLSEYVCPSVKLEDICIPAPVFEISAPIGPKYGVNVDSSVINVALVKNMPTFDDINVFRGVYVKNGHVNFGVSDAFMIRFAEMIADELPSDPIDDPIFLPDGASNACASYAHVRLMNYSSVNHVYIPSTAKRRALWLCLGLAEERTTVKQRRAHVAAVRAVLDALPNDEGLFGGRVAAAMATLIRRCDPNRVHLKGYIEYAD